MVAINESMEPTWQLEDIYGSYDHSTKLPKFDALYRSIEACYRGLEPFRQLNRKLVREYAGPAYGECETKRKYLNLTSQLIDAYMMMLAANRPTADITTRYPSLRPYAKHYETGVNNLIGEIGLEGTIRRWVLDACFTAGIIKVHQKDAGEVQFEQNLWMDPGTPFASNVSLDNFVYDTGARSWGELRWAGDMYRLSMEDLEEGVRLGIYNPDVAATAKPSSKFAVDKDRLEEFSRGNETDLDECEPMIDVADIWVKRDRRIYTFVVTDRARFCIKGQTPLAVMDWEDPETGPYHILGFSEVPENIMPIGPAVHLDELERLINNMLRKQARRAMRHKEATVFSAQAADTAKRWQNTNDGGMLQGDATTIGKLVDGGLDPMAMQGISTFIALYKDAGGNLDALRGTGASAGTVGQEQLIHDAANRSIAQMQYRVMDATRRLIKSLAFMLWQDEFKEIAGEMVIEGTNYSVDATWRPGDREGNFLDYNFDINVYSMAYRPPAQRADSLMQYVERIVMPGMQMLMQQGGTIDMAALNEIMAGLLGLDELKQIVTFTVPTEAEESHPSTSLKPPNTTRTQIRKNVSSATAQGQAMQQQQQWSSLARSNGGAAPMPAAA